MKTTLLESVFNKVVGLQASRFIKNIARILRIPFLKNICEWLLLKIVTVLSFPQTTPFDA